MPSISDPNLLSSSLLTSATPLLRAMADAAKTHEAVRVSLDGQDWQVHGVGEMPTSRREVAWVTPDTDTTSVFVEALQQSFSEGVGDAVARALDLHPAPGKPLASRTIEQALVMAEVSQQALSGVNFLTRLQFSAVHDGADFRRISAATGHTALSEQQRKQIDAELDLSFAKATREGSQTVAHEAVEEWLRAALSSVGVAAPERKD